MAECKTCGDTFEPIPEAWGTDTCGGCLADRLELLLLTMGEPLVRKPMRRAERDVDVDFNVVPLRKQA